MAWKRLDHVTKAVLRRIDANAETGVAAPGTDKLNGKRAEPEGPAKVTGLRHTEGGDGTFGGTANSGQEDNRALRGRRWERTAIPERDAPSLAVRCHLRLVVDNTHAAPPP